MNNDKFDVIDVEVEEEVLEEEVLEETSVEEPQYSDEEIDTLCLELKKEIQSKETLSEYAFDVAQRIAMNSKEYLDHDTYLWTMYAYAKHYEEIGNINAKRWCEIRMQDVINAMKKKRPQQKALTFENTDFPFEWISQIENDTAFMNDEIASLGKQFVKVEITLGAAFFMLIKFVFRYSWVMSFVMIALLMFVNYKVSYKSLVKRYIFEQTKACREFVDDQSIITFDLPVYNS